MKLPVIKVSKKDKVGEFSHHTLDSIYGVKLLRELPSRVLRRALNPKNHTHESIRMAIGANTNPNWLIAEAAKVLYDRDEMDEEEFDRITR